MVATKSPECFFAAFASKQVFKILPELGEALDNLIANRHFWQASFSRPVRRLICGNVHETYRPVTMRCIAVCVPRVLTRLLRGQLLLGMHKLSNLTVNVLLPPFLSHSAGPAADGDGGCPRRPTGRGSGESSAALLL